jgi:CRP/FNR family transcriptional regulator, cyclic AMP receptor protein
MELTRVLSNNYVFRGIPKELIAGMALLADVRQYRGGDVLVRQFDQSSDLLILLDGNARIKSFSGETIAEFGPGSIIGEISLIDERPRSATVVCMGDVRIARIPSSIFRSFMESNPEAASRVYSNICNVLCRRLRSMNVHVDALAS